MYLQQTRQQPLPANVPLELRALLKAASNIVCGRLTVVAPDATRYHFSGDTVGPSAVLEVRRAGALRRVWTRGDTGFAEAFMDGDLDTPDLDALLELGALNERHLSRLLSEKTWFRLLQRVLHFLRANTRTGSRRNISAHYDLGNDFYRQWLDPSMTYSSATFEHPEQSLEHAQQAKYQRIFDALNLSRDDRVLEIGCGWGGFAIRAAERIGCRVTAVTLSTQQLEWSQRAARARGVESLIDFRLQDYRDVEGRFDAIVSIEMFEAVGEAYWDTYFKSLSQRLQPQGRAALQIITIDETVFESYRRSSDFIQRYIFPGGMLAPPRVLRQLAQRHGLVVKGENYFADDYARTLERWHERFLSVEGSVEAMGFDERFRRMWRYYLSYCRAGFVTGRIDLVQLLLANGRGDSCD